MQIEYMRTLVSSKDMRNVEKKNKDHRVCTQYSMSY